MRADAPRAGARPRSTVGATDHPMPATDYAAALGIGVAAAYIGAGLGARRRRGWSEIYALCLAVVLWTVYACSATLYHTSPGSIRVSSFFVLHLAFAALVFAFPTAVWGGMALDTRSRRRLETRLQPASKLAWPVAWLLAFLSVVVVGAAIYAHEIEPLRLSVTRLELRTPKLRAGERPLRIVHLTDLHLEPSRVSAAIRARLLSEVTALQPDLVLWGGDYVSDWDGVPAAQRLLVEASRQARLGGCAVAGNWPADRGVLEFPAGTKGAPAVLSNAKALVRTAEGEVYVVGVPYTDPSPDRAQAERGVPAGAFRVLLAHSPREAVGVHGYDLILCGHTHGGQLHVPGWQRVARRFAQAPYAAGRYDLSGQLLYVNRGVGLEGGAAPRLRFRCPPEVLVVDVVGTGPVAEASRGG